MQRIGRPTVRDAAYTGTRHPNRLWTFAKTPKGLAAFGSAGLLVVASTVMAAVLWSQDATISSASQDSDISFLDGGGGVLGFATVSIGSSGASASISLTGIAGAADFQVTDLLQIQNSDLSQAYSITLIRSADPNAAIDDLIFTVLDGLTVIETYDAADAAQGSAFTLPAGETYDIRLNMAIADGTAAGSLGSIDVGFQISPV